MMADKYPQLGVKAVFDDSEAQKRMESYQKRLADVEKAVTKFTQQAERTAKRRADAAKKASSSQIKALIAFRRQLITVLFFLRFFTQAVRAAWQGMVEAAETSTLTHGIKALASAYGQSLGDITSAMNDVAGSIVGDANNIRAAQAGLLADHGRFVEKYDELWQAARVASVTAGGDATKIFGQLVAALNSADASMVDATSGIYNVETALIQFAVASGRTSNELSMQEKRQVILNEVMNTTNRLLKSGAQDALDASSSIDSLRKGWDALVGTFSGAILEVMKYNEVSIAAGKATEIMAITMAAYVGTVFAGVSAVRQLAIEVADLLTLGLLFDKNREGGLAGMVDRIIVAGKEASTSGFSLIWDQFKAQMGDIGDGGIGGAASTVVPGEAELGEQLRRYEEFLKKIHSLRERYMKEMETLELRYTQRLEELEFIRQQRLEDIYIKAQRKREDLQLKLQRRLEDADRDYYRALERLERTNARKRERIWQRYWEAVRRINRTFMTDIYDAIASRDATAALKAIRKRRDDLDDASHTRNLALQNLRRDNETELEELRIKRQRAIDDAKRSYEEGLEDLRRWIKREEEELVRSLETRRQQIEAWHKWRLKAIGEQYKLEYLQAYTAYTGQEQLLQDHVNRMNALWASMMSSLGIPAIPAPPGTSGNTGGSIPQGFAHGGAGIFDRPTRIIVGEGPSPEMVVAVQIGGQVPAPVQTSGMNVSHDFAGTMDHKINAQISGAIGGLEGRMQAAFIDALQRVM